MVLFYQVLEWFFFTAFVVSAILLIIVILLQEGKGGGIADAFGGMGGETFGHRASGISRFTGWLAFTFMGCALLIPIASRQIVREREIGAEPPKIDNPVNPPDKPR